MQTPILHHYDASPFSQKAQKMLGIKGLTWQSVEMPMTAPKPELEALTGGYRGTPVLQLGADFYVDNVAIAEALDEYFAAAPSLLGATTTLIQDAFGFWSDAFFEPILRAAMATHSAEWDETFYRDREKVFPHLDFTQLRLTREKWNQQIIHQAGEFNEQLADGRHFVFGDEPSLADVHAWGMMWFIRNGLPEVSSRLEGARFLPDWERRLNDIGMGERVTADYNAASAAVHKEAVTIDAIDSLRMVSVSAIGADRGTVTGRLVCELDRQTIIAVEHPTGSYTQVHFPVRGYELKMM